MSTLTKPATTGVKISDTVLTLSGDEFRALCSDVTAAQAMHGLDATVAYTYTHGPRQGEHGKITGRLGYTPRGGVQSEHVSVESPLKVRVIHAYDHDLPTVVTAVTIY